jgi:NAD(P)-dependent dehydrogenase (short-subunit alcohol dehydrogenase family)
MLRHSPAIRHKVAPQSHRIAKLSESARIVKTDKTNRTVIVTGAGRGIGVKVAEKFAAEGDRVVVVDLLLDRAQATAKTIEEKGGTALALACDVSSSKAVDEMVAAVIDRFGSIDVLVNCAGGYVRPKMPHETTEEAWDLTIDSNLKGTFLVCKSVLPHMMKQRSGRIINFASNAARSVATGLGCEYTAAKAGVTGLTRHMAKEYAPYNILINALAPGPTNVERLRENKTEEMLAGLAKPIPVGRLGRPEEHAEVVFFMASEGASFMTGATIDNNGGIIMV